MKKLPIKIACIASMLAGCSTTATSSTQNTYTSISMAEAQEVFSSSTNMDYLIVDVRTVQEYEEGHIEYAINIPNEEIDVDKPSELPDLDQTIYVYCRSGNRSKQAAQKLVNIGYTNIIECGGITDYTETLTTIQYSYADSDESLEQIIGTWSNSEQEYTLTITQDTSYHGILTKNDTVLMDADFTVFLSTDGSYVCEGLTGEMLNADCNNYNVIQSVKFLTMDNTYQFNIEMIEKDESKSLILYHTNA